MANIEIVDQTFRDGQQSLWGMRIRTGMLAAVAPLVNRAGYRALDITGSSMFECTVRYAKEDPWEGLDLWRQWMPDVPFRCGVGSNRIGTFGMTPECLLDLWVRTLIRHGLDSFWVYDCLYNLDQMQRLCRVIDEAGGQALGAIMYGISPVHTDEWFAARVREMAGWGCVSGFYIEDAPGILTPERARTLVPALLEAAGALPVEFHFHNTTGMGAYNYVIALEAGARILHTCARSMANGPSLPSTEQTLENVRWLGHEHGIDESVLPAISEHCARIARQEGWEIGVPNEYSAFAYRHHLPGGMTGTLKKQLAQYGMEDRLGEVLEETVRVRAEMGHPISATPFSQIIGIQSVLNVVTGERWGTVPDESVLYLGGHYGRPPAPLDENVRDKVLNSEHGKRFAGWQRPQPTLDEVRQQYGGTHLSDEELLLRYLAPAEDLAATRAAGPARRGYDFHDRMSMNDLLNHLLTLKRPRQVVVSGPTGDLVLKRSETGFTAVGAGTAGEHA
ncbi:MAG: carboxyltransferase [Gammaproteobacteria bacterium]|nr:carboxyltransferase [Gammaproteobacteria bacterium]